MIFKILGGAMIVFSGFGIGCILTKKLKARSGFLSEFCVFISLLQTQIRYNSADIFTLVKSSANASGLDFFIDDADISFNEFWRASIDNIPKKYGLNNSDIELLFEFGSGLGTTDIEGQLRHIELYSEMFNSRLEESKTILKDKSRIYRALGLFGGVSTALIFL